MVRQLSLWDPEPASEEPRSVGPAAVDADVVELGARLPPHVFLGTSSWSFPGWQGLVYDRTAPERTLARDGLRAYAEHPLLRTVSIDRTFYGPVDEPTLRRYAESVPAGFRFVVKAHQSCTWARYPNHPRYGELRGRANPRFLDPHHATTEVLDPLRRNLGDALAIVLFQFPPQERGAAGPPGALARRLQEFLRSLPSGPTYAVEIRQHRWLDPAYGRALREVGAAHCYSVHPTMPPVSRQTRVVPPDPHTPILIRWMLAPDLDYAKAKTAFFPFTDLCAPDPRTRAEIADLVRDQSGAQPVFVIANNKAEGSSPQTLAMLARELVQ